MAGVLVHYIGNKKDYKYRGHAFPCKMSVATARTLIANNPKTFKSDELNEYLAQTGDTFQEPEVIEEENEESQGDEE